MHNIAKIIPHKNRDYIQRERTSMKSTTLSKLLGTKTPDHSKKVLIEDDFS